MSSASKSQKRRNKKKYFQSSKKSKCDTLECGMKGFLITCSDEYRCVKEAYNLLNEFADELYGPEFEGPEKKGSEELDLEEQLAKEIAAFTSKKRRFQQVSTKVKGIIFINTTISDPVPLVDKIFESIIKTGLRKTRFILRLKPVIATCKAYESDIKKALDDILLKFSSERNNEELTYKVESKIRHNDTITSSHVIWYVRESVKDAMPKWTACIVEPQLIISFYILRTVCCISMLTKYNKYKKYNLSEITSPTVQNTVLSNEKDDSGKAKATEGALQFDSLATPTVQSTGFSSDENVAILKEGSVKVETSEDVL